ncbi:MULTISPECIES: 50S ribosomal protein bL37 [Kitasatospora]|uniref:50S ribosomal protein bL37 n=1 Tax=Kitasatospora TaxID=2063 RepID=UPI003CD07878
MPDGASGSLHHRGMPSRVRHLPLQNAGRGTGMSKRARKQKARKKKRANHGRRPNQ